MLAQRLRRWPNIKTSLFQRVVFTGYDARPTLAQHWVNVSCLLGCLLVQRCSNLIVNRTRLANAVLMLGGHRRRQ